MPPAFARCFVIELMYRNMPNNISQDHNIHNIIDNRRKPHDGTDIKVNNDAVRALSLEHVCHITSIFSIHEDEFVLINCVSKVVPRPSSVPSLPRRSCLTSAHNRFQAEHNISAKNNALLWGNISHRFLYS